MKLEILECPICHKQMKSLTAHLRRTHKLTMEEIRVRFPDQVLHIDSRTKRNIKCPYCDHYSEYNNVHINHLKKCHPEEYRCMKSADVINDDHKLVCSICGYKTTQLSQHVTQSHNMEWDEYCEIYKYGGPKCVFSDNHKKVLSTNKKIFYETEDGLKWKEHASNRFSGDSNPACRPEVRKKISDAAVKRAKTSSDPFYTNSYGIRVSFTHNKHKYNLRSFTEFMVVYCLIENRIDFQYEKNIVKYRDMNNIIRNYICDLVIDDRYFEIKSSNSRGCLQENNENHKHKYVSVKQALNNLDKSFDFLTIGNMKNLLNVTPENKQHYINVCKRLLKDNDITFFTNLQHGRKQSRILRAIDVNYETNPNITVRRR